MSKLLGHAVSLKNVILLAGFLSKRKEETRMTRLYISLDLFIFTVKRIKKDISERERETERGRDR